LNADAAVGAAQTMLAERAHTIWNERCKAFEEQWRAECKQRKEQAQKDKDEVERQKRDAAGLRRSLSLLHLCGCRRRLRRSPMQMKKW
jgi:hypothetical protein